MVVDRILILTEVYGFLEDARGGGEGGGAPYNFQTRVHVLLPAQRKCFVNRILSAMSPNDLPNIAAWSGSKERSSSH